MSIARFGPKWRGERRLRAPAASEYSLFCSYRATEAGDPGWRRQIFHPQNSTTRPMLGCDELLVTDVAVARATRAFEFERVGMTGSAVGRNGPPGRVGGGRPEVVVAAPRSSFDPRRVKKDLQ
jgi:hypothetical protein